VQSEHYEAADNTLHFVTEVTENGTKQ